MSRLVVLDTETTGLSAREGDRIVEIGCVELISLRKGESRQWYLNPERTIPAEASRVHGITDAMVAKAPVFREVAEELRQFIGSDRMVIHNAPFDLGFLNAEFNRIGLPPLPAGQVIDTIPLSRKKFPNASASLDNLCKRLGVDLTRRTLHGALLDANLLAEAYIALCGGHRRQLDFSDPEPTTAPPPDRVAAVPGLGVVMPPRYWPLGEEETIAHQTYLQLLQKESGNCLWLRETSQS